MKNHFKTSFVVLCLVCIGCGGDEDPTNNTTNNGSNGSNNVTTASNNKTTVGSNNQSSGSNNITSTTNNATNNATNNVTTGTNNETNGTVSLDGVRAKYDELICDIAFNCSGQSPRVFRASVGGRFATEEMCAMSGVSAAFLSGFADLEESIKAGRVTFDETKVDACIAALRTDICSSVPGGGNPPECDSVFEGTVAAGDTCVRGEGCVDGLFCNDTDTCFGMCVTIPPDCGAVFCADTEYCDQDTVCQTRVAVGQICESTQECVESATCDTSGIVGNCVAFASMSDGNPCSNDIVCGANSICSNNICTALTEIPNGGVCNIFDPTDCEKGTTCVDVDLGSGDGVCGPAKSAGGSCIFFQQCQFGLDCLGVDAANGQKGTCEPGLPTGAPCANPTVCAEFVCEEETCGLADVCTIQ